MTHFEFVAHVPGPDGPVQLSACSTCYAVVPGQVGRAGHVEWHAAEQPVFTTPEAKVWSPPKYETRVAVDYEVIRTWAKANGHSVADKGRIPNAVITAYGEAHQ